MSRCKMCTKLTKDGDIYLCTWYGATIYESNITKDVYCEGYRKK